MDQYTQLLDTYVYSWEIGLIHSKFKPTRFHVTATDIDREDKAIQFTFIEIYHVFYYSKIQQFTKPILGMK